MTDTELNDELIKRISELSHTIEQQDAIIGRLTRSNEDLRDSVSRRNDWLHEAKKKAGYNDDISFDVIWKEALDNYFNRKKLTAAKPPSTANELLPCPFCGSDEVYVDYWVFSGHYMIMHIHEDMCDVRMQLSNKDKLIQQWNTRTAANPLTVESVVEAVKEKAWEYATKQHVDYNGLNDVARWQIRDAFIAGAKLATSKTPTVVINNNPINPFFI